MKEVLDAIKSLDQKIVLVQDKMVDMEDKIVGIQDRMDSMENKMVGMQDRMDRMEDRMDSMEEKMVNMQEEMSDMRKELKQEILDTRFILEQQYGEKINSMYDVLVMAKDKEYDNHKDIEKLDNRLTRAEANIFKQGEDFKVLAQTR